MSYKEMSQEALIEIILNQEEELKSLEGIKASLWVEATTDKETGAYKKDYGKELLQKELDIATKSDKSLVVAFVDFDNLKQVNNNFGHNEGDKYLLNILQIIKHNVRENDFLVRWGGDEFVIVFLGTTIKKIGYVWDRVLAAIGGFNHNSKYEMAISYGFAEYNSEHMEEVTLEQMIQWADEEMYKCKHSKAVSTL